MSRWIHNFLLPILLVILFTGFQQSLWAQTNANCDFTWSKFMGSATPDEANDVSVDGDGNVVVVGNYTAAFSVQTTNFTSRGGDDVYVMKFDPEGNLLWARSGGGTGSDRGFGVTTDVNRNVYIVGIFEGTSTWESQDLVSAGAADIFIVKYDRDGIFQWAKRAGGTGGDVANAVATSQDGLLVYFCGGVSGSPDFDGVTEILVGAGLDAFLATFDNSGNYNNVAIGGGAGDDLASDVAVGGDGDVAIVGRFNASATFGRPDQNVSSVGSAQGDDDDDIFVACYAGGGTGSLLWITSAGSVGSDLGNSITAGLANEYYVTGTLISSPALFPGLPDPNITWSEVGGSAFVARISDNVTRGDFDWVSPIVGSGFAIGFGVTVDPNAEVLYATGIFNFNYSFGSINLSIPGPNPSLLNGYLAQYSMASGTTNWAIQYGDNGTDEGRGVAVDDDGRVFVVGSTEGITFGCRSYETVGSRDGFLVVYDCPVAAVVANATKTNVTTPGGTEGTITGTGTGGGGTRFEYSLNESVFVTSGNFADLAAGTYELIARAPNFCTNTLSIEILEDVPCNSPSNLTFNNVQGNSVDLTWTTVPGAVGYRVYFTDRTTMVTDSVIVNTATPTFPYTLSPLNGTTDYRVRVVTLCAVNISLPTPFVDFTTLSGCDVPALQLVSTTFTTAEIRWNRSSQDVRFEGEIKLQADASWGGAFTTTDSSRSFTGLTLGSTYMVRVKRFCTSGGESIFDTLTFTTGSCTAPAGLNLSLVSTGIRVRWTALPGAVGYEVQFRVVNAPTWSGAINATGTETVVTGIMPLLSYEVRVRSVCIANTTFSPFTSPLTIAVPSCAVPVLTATPVSSGLLLAWLPVFGAAYYELQFRQLNGPIWSGITIRTDTFQLFTGLAGGSTYEFRVRSVCQPDIEVSAFGTTSFELAACTAPTGLTVCGLNPVRVVWDAVPNALGYQLSYRPINKSTWTLAQVSGTFATLAGAFNQTPYIVRVRTVCTGGGVSAYSTPVTSEICANTCPVPTNVMLNDFLLTSRQADIMWDAVLGAVSYEVRYKRVLDANWTSNFTLTPNFLITGLSPNVRYEVQVRTVCLFNEVSPLTPSLDFTTPTGACATPEDLRVVSVTDTTITLTWTPLSAARSYEIRWQIENDFVWKDTTTTNDRITLPNLTPGQPHTITIRSRCILNDVSTFLPPIRVIPVGNCPVPTGLVAAVPTKTEAILSWLPVNGALSYIVQYRLLGETDWTSFQVTDTEAPINLLIPDTTYEYTVVTVCGTSSRSPEAEIETFNTFGPCPLPTALAFTQITTTSALVGWTAAPGFTNYELEYRRADVPTWTSVPTVSGNSFNLSDLEEMVLYVVRIRTVCEPTFSLSPYVLDSFTTFVGGCAVPNNLRASRVGIDDWEIRWEGSADAVEYELVYENLETNAIVSRIITSGTQDLLTELDAFDIYSVRVRAICIDEAQSEFTDTIHIGGQPCFDVGTISIVKLSVDSIRVSWTAVQTGEGYEVTVTNLVNNTSGIFPVNDPSINVYDVSGLTPGTRYRMRVDVTPINPECEGSVIEFTTLPVGGCAPPTGLAFTFPTETSAQVTWTQRVGATGYIARIESLQPANTVLQVIVGGSDTSLTIQPTTPGNTYRVIIRSVCTTDSSAFGDTLTFTIPVPAPCPPPTSFVLTQIDPTSIRVDWGRVNTVPAYELSYRPVTRSNWTTIPGLPGPRFTLRGLPVGVRILVRVRSLCTDIDTFSVYLMDSLPKPTPCPAPQGIAASAITSGSALATWNLVAGVATYELSYRPKTSSTWTTIPGLSGPTFLLNSLVSNTDYDLRVRSRCTGPNDEAFSPYVVNSFKTAIASTCLPPTNLRVSSLSPTRILVLWNPGTPAPAYEVQYRRVNDPNLVTRTVIGATTDTLSALLVNTVYEVRVRALCDDITSSTFTAFLNFATGSPCLPVTGLSVVPNLTSAQVNWTASIGANGYRVEVRRPNAAVFLTQTLTPGSTNSFTINGLTEDTQYEVRLTTLCTNSEADPTNWTAFRTTFVPTCPIPTNFLIEPFATSALVSWTTVSGAVGYEVEYRALNSSNFIKVTVNDPNLNSVRIQSLLRTTAYEVRMRTICSFGLSGFTETELFATLAQDPTSCPSPRNLQVKAFANRANLTWTPAFNAIGYDIEWREVSEQDFNVIPLNGPTVSSFTLNGLEEGRTYVVQIVTRCPNGLSQPSEPVIFVAQPGICPAPTSVTVVPDGNNAIVFWLTQVGVLGYELEWREANSPISNFESITNPAVSTFIIPNLMPGKTYEVELVSVCIDGFSQASNRVTFDIVSDVCDGATNLQVSAGRTLADLSWVVPAGATGFRVSYRQLNPAGNPISLNLTQPVNKFRLSNLKPSTDYEVTLTTRCGTRTGGSIKQTFRTLAPKDDSPFAGDNVTPSMAVYPNPNRGEFTLTLDNLSGSSVRVNLLDITGRNIWNQTLYPQTDRIEVPIAPESIAAGVYLLRVFTDGGEEITKVVVQ